MCVKLIYDKFDVCKKKSTKLRYKNVSLFFLSFYLETSITGITCRKPAYPIAGNDQYFLNFLSFLLALVLKADC